MAKKNKFKHRRPQPSQARPEQVSAEVMSTLDLGYWNAATVQLPDWQACQIILVGAGGIGAYMAQHIGRLMHVVYQSNKGIHLTIVDPDVVEEANIGRQLFCNAEIGQPKAAALMRRYGQAWGLNVSSFVGKFDDSLLLGTGLTVLVGCVDNAEARQALAQTLADDSQAYWLDCGNLKDTGRVLLGNAADIESMRGAIDDKKCYALPSPALQSPGLLQPQPEELEDNDMSCAEMAAANLQSLNINARIAAEASDFLTRMLVTEDLKRFACEVNIAAGSSRSYYCTPDEVARVIKQPVAYVKAQATAVAV